MRYNLSEVSAADVADLRRIFNYDPDEGVLLWNDHPTQPHLNGKSVGISRGRVKLNNRYMSVTRLCYVLKSGDSPPEPYILFRDSNMRNIRWDNLYPCHRSVTPEKAMENDAKVREKFSGMPLQTRKTATEMTPEELFLAAVHKTREGIKNITGVDPTDIELKAECLLLANQAIEDANT